MFLSTAKMIKTLAAIAVMVVVAVPQAFGDERLTASEIRKVAPGNWSGHYKGTPLKLSIATNGTVTGRYAGIPARGHWGVKGSAKGDKFCLTFSATVSQTKCGELFRKGDNIVYGYLNRGKPRLRLTRS